MFKRTTTLSIIALFLGLISLTASASNCPSDCTAMPQHPIPVDCFTEYVFVNCVGTIGEPYVKSSQRTGVNQMAISSCNSCSQENKGSVAAGFGEVTVDTTWEVNIPYGIGSVSGGGASTSVDLSGTLNCQDCAYVQAPFYKYDVKVTMGIPYTLEKRVLYTVYPFVLTGPCADIHDTMVSVQCGNNYEATATYDTYEGGLGTTSNLPCPERCCEPCKNDLGGCPCAECGE